MSTSNESGAGKPLDPKKLLREAIAGGDADFASSGWQPPSVDELGERFPELDIVELIGRGGMGAVYRVVQRKLDRTVALKVLPPELAQDPAFEERFLREARALAGLKHERILTVHDFGERKGLYYLVTEFVEGMNLRQLMDMGELSPHEALRITPQICEALQYAHDHGVVHRDIKPENLLIDLAGEVRIADFGLARILNDNPDALALTRSTQVLGTPQYMAPEQWRDGQNVDHRADIYAVGVVLYEMLTGQLPLGHFDPPSQRDGVPRGLDAIVQRSLAQRPEQRYQRASEVSDELARQELPPRTGTQEAKEALRADAGTAQRRTMPRRKAPWALGLAWVTLALTVLGGVMAVNKVQTEIATYDSEMEGYRYVHRTAREWVKREQKDVSAADTLTVYYRDKVWPEWDQRRANAIRNGLPWSTPRPVLPTEPDPPRKVLFHELMSSLLIFAIIFTLGGFAAVRRVRESGSTDWLALSIVTAWTLPVVLLMVTPFVVAAINYQERQAVVVAALLIGVGLGVKAIVVLVRYHRRLTEEIRSR